MDTAAALSDRDGGSFRFSASPRLLPAGGARKSSAAPPRYECCEGPMGSSNALALMLELQGRDLAAGVSPNPRMR